MRKIILVASLLVLVLFFSGCYFQPDPLGEAAKKPKPDGGGGGKPECKTGQTQSCTTLENCPGIQECINKKWSPCEDISDDGCPACIESWSCTPWSECIDGYMARTCVDDNDCGTTNDKPEETQFCGCTIGETRDCTTAEGCFGTQDCVNYEWQNCVDIPDDGCPAIPEPYITVSQINPTTDTSYPVWTIFDYTTNITCYDGNCGAITSSLYFVDGNQTMVPNSGTPFYTTDSNPQICSEMHSGETCTNTWQVTVTGTPGNTYSFFVEYMPFDTSISSETTPTINITIDTNSS